jgi:hypothetical protein
MTRPAAVIAEQISTWERVTIEAVAVGDEILTGAGDDMAPLVKFAPVVARVWSAYRGMPAWCVRVADDPIPRWFPQRAPVVRRAPARS